MVIKTPLSPAYKKDNGLWNLRTDQLPIPADFVVREQGIIYLPAGAFGGNHKHPRGELFVGIGDDLFIVWQDDHGKQHEERMMDGEQLYLFEVKPNTPHAVVNKSQTFAILVELATGANINVEPVELLGLAR